MATNPTLITTPFAQSGDKTTPPNTNTPSDGRFSQTLGFPPVTAIPLGSGGKAPKREDFNGAFNMLSALMFYAQKGFTFNYDSSQDYYTGCVVIDPSDGLRYECIADMSAGTIAPHSDTGGTYWTVYGGGITPENIPAYNKKVVVTTSGTYSAPVTGWYRITAIGGGGAGGHGASASKGGLGGGQGGTTSFGSIASASGGSGGGGGGGSNNYAAGGGGGGAGEVSVAFTYMTQGTTKTVTIGAGAAQQSSNSTTTSGTSGTGPSAGGGGANYVGGGGAAGASNGCSQGSGGLSGTGGAGGRNGTGYGGGGGGGAGTYSGGTSGGSAADGGSYGGSQSGGGYGGAGGNGAVIIEYFDPSLNP